MQLVKKGAAQGEWFPYATPDTAPDDVAEFRVRRIPAAVRERIQKERFPEKTKITYRKGAMELDRESERARLANIDAAAYALVDGKNVEVPASLVGEGGDEFVSLDGRLGGDSNEVKRRFLSELGDIVEFILECSDSLEVKRIKKEVELGET